ncbi:cytochrome c3 family protein [Shewanella zhangzhouensis]|nr:cytochrome c3 family protein [Shewanella zhangzhouensis]
MFASVSHFSFATDTTTVIDQGKVTGRIYHSSIYKGSKECKSCHGVNEPSQRPADNACQKCHNIDKLAAKTINSGHNEYENPHNNMHYGKRVPCQDCHGEHQTKEVMCNNCHEFNFKNHK